MRKPNKSELDELFNRRVESVVGEKELRAKLISGKKLLIKHGVDPTTALLHIGHATAYHKMREFQNLGHTVQFLVGGFTARFGDPTDRSHSRQLQSKAEVMKLAKQYLNQALKILDPKKTEIRYNSEWYDKLSAESLIELMSHFTHQQMIERDMFQKRLKAKLEIRFHEPVYPLLQAYDSVVLKDDLTVIGTDQLFNEMRGRDLQRDFGQEPQAIITVPLLVGTDGKNKMSKTLGNAINILDEPKAQYGKIMSVPDTLIYTYFDLATNINSAELGRIKKQLADKHTNPRDLKMELAHKIVSMYHGGLAADKAQDDFVKVFQKHSVPSNIPAVSIKKPTPLIDILLENGLVTSKSEFRRLLDQKGVKVDGHVVTDLGYELRPPTEPRDSGQLKTSATIQVGKRRFLQIKP
ncbi:tyrosine--tRNA ligase [Patescibacteria group bacterium]|nr:tyrosine--tRNA ligase [Patescibacteria group bacterium]